MKKTLDNKIFLICLHILIGFIASYFRGLMKFALPLVLIILTYKILTGKDKVFEVLRAVCYVAGAEVFFRMTKAVVFYETGKYVIVFFFLLGLFFHGFKNRALPYIGYLVFLLPGVLLSLNYYSYDLFLFRKNISFNLSGPICLAIAAIYCISVRIKHKTFQEILNYIIYPLISMVVYITLYAPSLNKLNSVGSNSALSGGYGPNQVSTVLGLGVFILFTRFLIPYKKKWVHFVMMFLLVAMAYRALLTFSRGGVLVAIGMALAFTVVLYIFTGIKTKTKTKVTLKLLGTFGLTVGIWLIAVLQTGGLLENRYSNENTQGEVKEDVTTGRVDLFMTEIQAFIDHPFLGGGVGSSKVYHEKELGVEAASHNEVSRMIGEHGLIGILALLILIITPLMTKLQGRSNVYFYPFLIFWFLTILHSSMRIAAPGLIYGLALIDLSYGQKKKKAATLPREQVV